MMLIAKSSFASSRIRFFVYALGTAIALAWLKHFLRSHRSGLYVSGRTPCVPWAPMTSGFPYFFAERAAGIQYGKEKRSCTTSNEETSNVRKYPGPFLSKIRYTYFGNSHRTEKGSAIRAAASC